MVSKFDVFYALLILRKKQLEEREAPEKLGIRVNDIAEYIEIDYKSAYAHITNLLEEGYIFDKEDGTYLPYVKRQFDRLIYSIYTECEDRKIEPNFLLNETATEIIRKGLGRKNIILKQLYPEYNHRTLKRYFSFFVKNDFVFIGEKLKPAIFHFNDDHFLRLILKVFGKLPDIDKEEGTEGELNVSETLKEIVKELNLIERNKSTKKVEFAQITREQRMHFIAHTTALEGNPMNYNDVKVLLEEGKILGNYNIIDIDENRNINKALKYVEEHLNDETLTEDLIKEVHYITLEGLEKKEYESRGGWKNIAGKYRGYSVSIKNNPNFKVASSKKVGDLMKKFIKELEEKLVVLDTLVATNEKNIEEKIRFATWLHSEFQHIHPFGDGNSRTTRLLFNLVLMRFGFPLIDIYASLEYMKYTKREKSRDDEVLYQFFLRLILHNLKKINMELR